MGRTPRTFLGQIAFGMAVLSGLAIFGNARDASYGKHALELCLAGGISILLALWIHELGKLAVAKAHGLTILQSTFWPFLVWRSKQVWRAWIPDRWAYEAGLYGLGLPDRPLNTVQVMRWVTLGGILANVAWAGLALALSRYAVFRDPVTSARDTQSLVVFLTSCSVFSGLAALIYLSRPDGKNPLMWPGIVLYQTRRSPERERLAAIYRITSASCRGVRPRDQDPSDLEALHIPGDKGVAAGYARWHASATMLDRGDLDGARAALDEAYNLMPPSSVCDRNEVMIDLLYVDLLLGREPGEVDAAYRNHAQVSNWHGWYLLQIQLNASQGKWDLVEAIGHWFLANCKRDESGLSEFLIERVDELLKAAYQIKNAPGEPGASSV